MKKIVLLSTWLLIFASGGILAQSNSNTIAPGAYVKCDRSKCTETRSCFTNKSDIHVMVMPIVQQWADWIHLAPKETKSCASNYDVNYVDPEPAGAKKHVCYDVAQKHTVKIGQTLTVTNSGCSIR